MNVLAWPSWPWWGWGAAAVWVLYQGWRGWTLQWDFGPNAQDRFVRPWRFRMQRCLADAILYVVCAATGPSALYLAAAVVRSASKISDLSGGAATLAVALGVVGLLGVTGALPHLIQGGKILPH